MYSEIIDGKVNLKIYEINDGADSKNVIVKVKNMVYRCERGGM